jgi:hypothetical protein
MRKCGCRCNGCINRRDALINFAESATMERIDMLYFSMGELVHRVYVVALTTKGTSRRQPLFPWVQYYWNPKGFLAWSLSSTSNTSEPDQLVTKASSLTSEILSPLERFLAISHWNRRCRTSAGPWWHTEHLPLVPMCQLTRMDLRGIIPWWALHMNILLLLGISRRHNSLQTELMPMIQVRRAAPPCTPPRKHASIRDGSPIGQSTFCFYCSARR